MKKKEIGGMKILLELLSYHQNINNNTNLVDELSATVDALCSITGNLTNPLNMANHLKSEKKIKIDII